MSRLADAFFLVMDTETTGIDPATCKVVEFAWVLTDLIGPKAAGTTLVNPGVPAPTGPSGAPSPLDYGSQEIPF